VIRFVTGTDTGVGKTVASAWLAAAARAEGRAVRYVKPVQTGLAAGAWGSDADFVRAAADVDARELLRFPEPLAPAVAAELAGTPIDAEALVAAVKTLAADVEELLVEGAGGLLVPLADGWTMADLASALGAEVVVVTRPALGTLNHTALTLEAAHTRGLTVAGLVISGWPSKSDITERTNLERLAAMAPVLDRIPNVDGLSVEGGTVAGFSAALQT
jgi:dethiobiotin synthetase